MSRCQDTWRCGGYSSFAIFYQLLIEVGKSSTTGLHSQPEIVEALTLHRNTLTSLGAGTI